MAIGLPSAIYERTWFKDIMNYWLLKSEPDVWSIDEQIKMAEKGAPWDGVRNYQAANYLRKMKKKDLCFFYHSNIGKEIVGVVQVIKSAFPDKSDKSGRFVAVQVRFIEKFKNPVKLEFIKKNPKISHLPLIKQSRLSVMPIDFKSWKIICKMGRISQGRLKVPKKKKRKKAKKIKKRRVFKKTSKKKRKKIRRRKISKN